ncbi:MAG: class I SAM-dependent methyltransferase [Desulfuromonadales bacterium]|nr:class I SAM-dependent methyltransferase [Desulfuromonadales bacterium]
MNEAMESARYLRTCRSEFWRKVFAAELDYLWQHLRSGDEILSVGCGPAIIESGLDEHGFAVVGLDVSQEALACIPDTIRTIVAPAEKMPFPDAAFDVVLFIVSLQFIENYRGALSETVRVLRPGGRVIAMLLNPASDFFKRKRAETDSYVRKIRHTDLQKLESAIAEGFKVQGEYFLGIADNQIFPSRDLETAALYVIQGSKVKTAKQ